MKRLAVLVIILACALLAPASASAQDPRCDRANQLVAAQKEKVVTAKQNLRKAKNKLRNATGKKARKKAKKAKNKATNRLADEKGDLAGVERRAEQYCRGDDGGGGKERPTKPGRP